MWAVFWDRFWMCTTKVWCSRACPVSYVRHGRLALKFLAFQRPLSAKVLLFIGYSAPEHNQRRCFIWCQTTGKTSRYLSFAADTNLAFVLQKIDIFSVSLGLLLKTRIKIEAVTDLVWTMPINAKGLIVCMSRYGQFCILSPVYIVDFYVYISVPLRK
jgi:hypothetical protein